MRTVAVVLLCSLVLLSPATAGDRTFPYKNYVAADEAYVYSGPGQGYYPTDKLTRGQQVEVYRHDPGGWCAIQPIDGSFTWVSGLYLKPAEGNLAIVTNESVVARVGSKISDSRDTIQVLLHKGEVVEVLDALPGGGFGENVWFKIAPPSGEFRWISAKYLSDDPPGNSSASLVSATETAGELPNTSSSSARSLSAEEYQAELDRIELGLSVMVIDPPTLWSFDSLRERANLLLNQAKTASERGRARQIADQIARFENIMQRQEAVLAMSHQTDPDLRWDGPRPNTNEREKPSAKFQTDSRFDAVGRLTQVVSPKVGAPRYALTGESGEVRCYVTPAPGVKLQDFVGLPVGVTGNRGYMIEQRASHIMARHVTPLEATVVR
jgi:hypothetical protein